ncbi:MAG: PQQ-dependent sugar dehydrogenase [Saprospiraceae bacterium]|nr:PQQ-dependent sugar dehydrogenase [Saprospiraceae bacterium]
MKNVGLICLLAFLFSLTSLLSSAQLPEDFSDELVLQNLEQPTGITFDETGTGYVWLKKGIVLSMDTLGQTAPEPLLDISEEVGDWGDHGLLGFALDPDYLSNGFFYLLYVVDRHHVLYYGTPDYDPNANQYLEATIGRITRYTADLSGDFPALVPDSRLVLLGTDMSDGFPILMKSHGVGSLVFGNDGTLLASCGEGAHFEGQDIGSNPNTYWEQALSDGLIEDRQNVGRFRAQLVNSLNGKIIRIDPETGQGVSSNPFYDSNDPGAAASRVWALGFRNPFRFILQPGTGGHFPEEGDPGTLLIGDVGGSMWEEVNLAASAGRNFGWPLYEAYDKNWPDFGEELQNQDAPNPFAGEPGCNLDFFRFIDLIQQPTLTGDPGFENPCSPSNSIPADIPVFTHTWPLIAWSNQLWNQPTRAQVGGFDPDGHPITIAIEDSAAGLQGLPFDGYSSIPGCFYTASVFPEEYQGAFFLLDLSGWIRVLAPDENQQFTRIDPFFETGQGLVSLSVNPYDGCLYFAQIYDGEIRKICYGGNPAPIAVIESDVNYGPNPLPVQFDGSASYDPFDLPITHFWDFGDGFTSTDVAPAHTFEAPDSNPISFTVVLEVTDSLGVVGRDEQLVSLNNTPPMVEITSVSDATLYTLTGMTWLPLKGLVKDLEHADSELSYAWELFFHHNDHYHAEPADTLAETFVLLEPVGCEQELYWYRIRLTVTDAAGLSAYDEVELFPDCGDPIFSIDPFTLMATETGIQLDWNTSLEDDILAFEIERTDTYQFLPIIRLSPKGAGNEYSFFDEDPIYGFNYYRIKAIRSDGRYAYSEIKLMEFPPPKDFRIFPNPVYNKLNVELQEATSEIIQFDLFTASGIPALTLRWNAVPGAAFSATADLNVLSAGPYYYRVIDGAKMYTGSVILN